MRIGVNAACLRGDAPADTGSMIIILLTTLCRRHPEHSFVLFFDGPPSGLQWPENVTTVTVPSGGSSNWQRSWWLEWKLPRAMKAQQVERLLSMDGTLPLRSRISACLFINDTGFLHSVAGLPASRQKFLAKRTVKYMQQAGKVLVLSHALEQELRQYAPAAAGRLQVLPVGLHESYRPPSWEEREAVKQAFTGGVEYFIAVGDLHPRNNILPLLKAFSALKRRLHSNMKLVLAGADTAAGAEIAASLSSYKFRHDVVRVPHPDQETLARLTGAAYALVYTARFEGAAMPVYAALQCQVPVIALDGPAAREAGADAALYTDPDNLEDLADKMCLIYKDEELRSRQLGKIAAERLPGSWDRAADALMEALLHGSPGR